MQKIVIIPEYTDKVLLLRVKCVLINHIFMNNF